MIFTHIFASTLQRAYKTAIAIQEPQKALFEEHTPDVVRFPELVEQDFGYYEGRSFMQRSEGSPISGKRAHYQEHKDEEGFVDMESKEAMGVRVDKFLDEQFMPIVQASAHEAQPVVAVVSHGIILAVLWRHLLARLPPGSVSLHPELLAGGRMIFLEHLGGWSNTGYLELHLDHTSSGGDDEAFTDNVGTLEKLDRATDGEQAAFTPATGLASTNPIKDAKWSKAIASQDEDTPKAVPPIRLEPTSRTTSKLAGWTTVIRAVNKTEHLKGLKRTGGGVGSSKHDEGQKNIDTFFKRQKTG